MVNAVLGAGTNSDSVFTLRSTAASSSFFVSKEFWRVGASISLSFGKRVNGCIVVSFRS